MKKFTKKISTVFVTSLFLAISILALSLVSDSINNIADAKEDAASAAINQSLFKDNVAYCNTENPSQTLDAYLLTHAEEPRPAIIYIHGGGWNQGDKQNTITNEYSKLFTDSDIAFIGVDYRLSSEAKYPAQNDDVRCAVEFVAANADEWNIDIEQLIIMGDSAGGQLASTELLRNKPLYDGAIIAYGVSNLWRQITSYHDKNAVGYLGSADKVLATQASPQSESFEGASPFLLIHGTADTVVPADESKNFAAKLKQAGAKATYFPIQGAPHAFLGTNNSFDQQAKDIIMDFIAHQW